MLPSLIAIVEIYGGLSKKYKKKIWERIFKRPNPYIFF